MLHSDFRSLRSIFWEQLLEKKEEKYVILWDNFETETNRIVFPGFLDSLLIFAYLKLFSVDVNSDDLNEDHKNPYKLKPIKLWKEWLSIVQSHEIGQFDVSL